MPYSPTTWVEGSTKLGPTNLNHIETGIDNATDTAEAAVPKSTVTATGDIIYATGSSAVSRLGIGTAHYMLCTNGTQTAPTWVPSPKSLMTGTGDMIYSSSANTLARLAAGTAGQILTMSGGVPTWATATGTTFTSYAKTTEKDVNGSSSKTDLLNGEITIGANVMSASGNIVLECGGDLKNSTGSGQTITLEIALGSTTLWGDLSAAIATDPSVRRGWYFRGVIQGLASTSAQRSGGIFTLGLANAASVAGTGSIDLNNIFCAPWLGVASTEDMTSSKTLTLSVTQSSSSANMSTRLEWATVRVS